LFNPAFFELVDARDIASTRGVTAKGVEMIGTGEVALTWLGVR
jgi:hypothetical protein